MLVNDARCKYLFDNVHGTGQSAWDAVMRSTNLVLAGKTVVIIGYGWCGKGCALRAQGLGANVVVCEVDPIKAADAMMNGCRVLPLREACPIADVVLTVTGGRHALRREHFPLLKNNVCWPMRVISGKKSMWRAWRKCRQSVESYALTLKDSISPTGIG